MGLTRDAPGRVKAVTDAKGNTTSSLLDSRDRATGEIYPDGSICKSYNVFGDPLGSVRLVTDSNGATVFSATYDAWGKALAVTDLVPGGMPYKFVGIYGCRQDKDTGLTYMRQRWYSGAESDGAGLQRFVSRDAVRGSNRYGYAHNNPAAYLDPFGLYPILVVTLRGGNSYIPMHQVKNPDQAKLLNKPEGTWVPIAVPPGVNPQGIIDYWRHYHSSVPLRCSVDFKNYWRPGGPHDYKITDPTLDAFGNFMFAASGSAAGYKDDTLMYVADDWLKGGNKDP